MEGVGLLVGQGVVVHMLLAGLGAAAGAGPEAVGRACGEAAGAPGIAGAGTLAVGAPQAVGALAGIAGALAILYWPNINVELNAIEIFLK